MTLHEGNPHVEAAQKGRASICEGGWVWPQKEQWELRGGHNRELAEMPGLPGGPNKYPDRKMPRNCFHCSTTLKEGHFPRRWNKLVW